MYKKDDWELGGVAHLNKGYNSSSAISDLPENMFSGKEIHNPNNENTKKEAL
jgi:hypothetical protein